ncbi:hypothetical protein H4582DRAFT_2062859 [Lactarius indigo]|nr:hypothetical protein H4582DRAFT_2062859 [Lactarius indigo]
MMEPSQDWRQKRCWRALVEDYLAVGVSDCFTARRWAKVTTSSVAINHTKYTCAGLPMNKVAQTAFLYDSINAGPFSRKKGNGREKTYYRWSSALLGSRTCPVFPGSDSMRVLAGYLVELRKERLRLRSEDRVTFEEMAEKTISERRYAGLHRQRGTSGGEVGREAEDAQLLRFGKDGGKRFQKVLYKIVNGDEKRSLFQY